MRFFSRVRRQRVNHSVWRFAVLWSCLLLGLTGCSRSQGPVTKPTVHVEERDDSLQRAVELFHQAQDRGQFREGLGQIRPHLVKAEVQPLDDKIRQLAQRLLGADADDLAEIDAAAPTLLDAAYLESCFFFRDAARALEVRKLPPQQQAALGFAWVMRNVLFHEQQDESLPPHLTVERGYGSVQDRALAVLELLRLWHLEGGLIEVPRDAGPPLQLLGVLVPDKDSFQLALFDPRLGFPVAGPKGQAVATLAEVRAQPELLKASGIDPARFQEATARLVIPLSALAPRLQGLEKLLVGHEHVVLHQDLVRLEQRLTSAGVKVVPATSGTSAATRGWRKFYPPEDGGIDKDKRLLQYTPSRAPLASVIYRYEQMRVFRDLPKDDARGMLTKITADLFDRYALEPRAQLLRGRHETALKRLDRIGNVIEQAEFAAPIAEPQFQRQIAAWRERLLAAYGAGDAHVKQLWAEDQYTWALLHTDDAAIPQKYEKKMLAHILLRACRESLGGLVEALKAACWEDKAAMLQAEADERARSGKPSDGLAQEATSAWKNARSAWAKFLDRADLTPAQVRTRIGMIQSLWRDGQRGLAVGVANQLHLDLHRAVEGRVGLARASHRLAQSPAALSVLTRAREDLAAIDKTTDAGKLLQDCLDQARTQPGSPLTKHLELLVRDWQPDGAIAAQRQRVDRLLQAWK